VVAKVGGRDARVLGPAKQALLTPDGTRVLGLDVVGGAAQLTLWTVAGRRRERVVATLAAAAYAPGSVRMLRWSADSRLVALRVEELSSAGAQDALVVINVGSGRITQIATGTLLGASFAPQGPDRLVYADASVAQLDENEASLYVVSADGADRRRLTHSGLASEPVWSGDWIFYARLVALGSPTRSPLYGLWRIEPNGHGSTRIAGVLGGPPVSDAAGAAITASASGRRLVADFASPDGAAAGDEVLALDLAGRHASVRTLTGVFADAVSRNGKLILATVYAAAPRIEALSWSGRTTRTLATAASGAGWND
jgi:hypothetical protein